MEAGSHTLSPTPRDGYLGVMVRGDDAEEVVDGGTVTPSWSEYQSVVIMG